MDEFVLIKPHQIEGENIANCHVFPAACDHGKIIEAEKHSCCNQVTRSRKPKVKKLGRWDNAIVMLAEMQRDGDEICGQCVATFYANDDS